MLLILDISSPLNESCFSNSHGRLFFTCWVAIWVFHRLFLDRGGWGVGGSGYHLCGQYPGTPPAGQISRITCQPQPITAQYVFIQPDRSVNPQEMEMCEVWAYGSKLTACYQIISIISSVILSFTTLMIGPLTVDVKITIWAQHNTYLELSMGFLANVPTDESPPTQSDGDIALVSVRPSVWFEVFGHWKGIIELTSNLAFLCI